MYVKRVQGAAWMDHGQRRHFVASYAFDDGFASDDELVRNITDLELPSDHFVHICFCGQWYAVNFISYQSHILVTKERVMATFKPYTSHPAEYPLNECPKGLLQAPPIRCDRKQWQDGIVHDLYLIDPDLQVVPYGEAAWQPFLLIENHALILMGVHSFTTFIGIKTNAYAEHVLSMYYNDNSLYRMKPDILLARDNGFTHYNPFRAEFCHEKDRAEKEAELRNHLPQPKEYAKRETLIDPVTGQEGYLLREREINPCCFLSRSKYGRTYRRSYW